LEVRPFFYVSMFALIAGLLLGGGTKAGFVSDAVLQLISIPMLLAALWRIRLAPGSSEMRAILAFCAVIIAVPLIQLVPLPPAIWTHLPGRESITETYELLGRPAPWGPLTMAPQSTWLVTLALLPPLAVFFAVLTLSWRERRLLSLIVVSFALVSAFFGLTQFAQGPDSALRFFEFTNPNSPVGFFANANHFAALLYSALLLMSAWVTTAIASKRLELQTHNDATDFSIAVVAALLGAMLVLIAAVVMTRSRAGFILMLVGLFGALALPREPSRKSRNSHFISVIVGLSALAVLFVGRSGLLGVIDRFGSDTLVDERQVFAHVTVQGAKTLMPVGAGLGAFVEAYPMFAKRNELVLGTYANHAHNDLLELWLETGLVGPLLLGLFLYWLLQRAICAWGPANDGPLAIDRSLIRAAILIIALLLSHSLVDYPLRTGAMMAILAFACALLVKPTDRATEAKSVTRVPEGDSARRLRSKKRLAQLQRQAANAWTPKPGSISARCIRPGIST
jgi:O-antigen ligase